MKIEVQRRGFAWDVRVGERYSKSENGLTRGSHDGLRGEIDEGRNDAADDFFNLDVF